MKRTLFSLIVLALALTAWAQAPDTKPLPGADHAYTITFNRPHAAGETYKLAVSLEAHTIGHMGIGQGASGGATDATLNLKGSVRVLKVNAIGEPTMFLLTVDQASLNNGKKDVPLDLDGAQIGAAYPGNKPRFVRRDGKALGRKAEMLLAQMFPMPKGINPDTYEGPGHPVKPGDSWPIRSEAVAKIFQGEGEGGIDPSKISGTVTFKGVENWNGVPCLHVVSTVTLKNVTMPHFLGSMRTDLTQDLLLPADPKVKKSREENDIVSDVFGKIISEDGKKLDIKSKSRVKVVTIVE